MKCLFIQKENILGDTIIITNKDYHHASKVFRLKPGDQLELKDSKLSYLSKLTSITKKQMSFSIVSKRKLKSPKLNITLCQEILKGNRFNHVLQKSTELGVSKIVPYNGERSVVHIENNDELIKLNRWQKICEEAAKQCGRDFIPLVTRIIRNLNELGKGSNNRLMAYEYEKSHSLKERLLDVKSDEEIFILIGSEGGFSEKELKTAKEIGFLSCSLGNNILRSETAALSMITNIFFYF